MSASIASYPLGSGGGGQTPHRKPLPQPGVAGRPQPQAQIVPDQQLYAQQYQNHSRSRTASSNVFPQMPSQGTNSPLPGNQNPISYQAHLNQYKPQRTHSNATTSTSSTGGPPNRQSSGSSLQRSTSRGSGNASLSYVALMRKQKATVWSDRAQFEDPRVAAQQRHAKMRAVMEISSASSSASGRASTSGSGGGVRSKIRHHGISKAQQYAPQTHPAIGVPMRLSANEVDEEEDDEESHTSQTFHQRTGSSRSSVGSGRLHSMYGMSAAQVNNQTATSSPASGMIGDGNNVADQTPVPEDYRRPDYFTQGRGDSGEGGSSGGSSERENSFGGIGKLPVRTKPEGGEETMKMDAADLQRRGSVDERTMTMSGYSRLFVANPDLSD